MTDWIKPMLYQSDKKNFDFSVTSCESANKVCSFVNLYQPVFSCHRYDNTPTALEYLLGLIQCEKKHGEHGKNGRGRGS